MTIRPCTGRQLTASVAGLCALACAGGFPAASAAGPGMGQLQQQLGQQQSLQQQLQGNLSTLTTQITSLNGQISVVQSRESAVSAQLSQARAALSSTQSQLQHQERVLKALRVQLGHAKQRLARQLVSNYESGSPNLVTVVLDANGFTDLLDQLTYLKDAERQQQRTITITRVDQTRARAAEVRLGRLEKRQRQSASAAVLEARALTGMSLLLHSKQSALQHDQWVQQNALSASQASIGQIQGAISSLQAQQAAQRAAAQQQASTPTASTGPAVTPSGGWAIPSAVVMCESGGQNLPPNSAGASGYYQILASTWRLYGGTGSAAYLAGKAEQDAVASRIWDGGRGASAWTCSAIVGIH